MYTRITPVSMWRGREYNKKRHEGIANLVTGQEPEPESPHGCGDPPLFSTGGSRSIQAMSKVCDEAVQDFTPRSPEFRSVKRVVWLVKATLGDGPG